MTKTGVLALFSFLSLELAIVSQVSAEMTETEMSGVSAELLELRQNGGVLRLAVRFVNGTERAASWGRFDAGKITIVDVKAKQKHFPIKDANGQWLAGPIGDSIDGGRIALKLPPRSDTMLWALFEPLSPGSVVNVQLPGAFPFEDVTVTEGQGRVLFPTTARSLPLGVSATLLSMKRADAALRARIRLDAQEGTEFDPVTSYFNIPEVYVFDPVSKRKYPVLKDSEKHWEAEPGANGWFILDPKPGRPQLLSLTLMAPPDTVRTVDFVLPQFLPFEGVTLLGEGGGSTGGIAAAGRSVGLEGALKELEAEVTPEEIKIDLSADVLFDFDKSDLKPAAEEKLQSLRTVVNGKPGSRVSIEGHTDVRGDAPYNQSLSKRRAESVAAWLVAHGVDASRLTTSGAGEARPLRTGDSEADHQANRRVEIRIRN